MKRVRVMIVDDEQQVLKALNRTLMDSGYEVVLFDDPQKAIKQMDQNYWDIILADYQMPLLNGLEVLKYAKRKVPRAVRILITGYADIDVIIKAVNEGSIYKYIAKPWSDQFFLSVMEDSVTYKQHADENRLLIDDILSENSEWSNITKSQENEIMTISEQGVQTLLKTIRGKDDLIYKHSLCVSWVVGRVGASLDLKNSDNQILRLAALFHDIGKIAIRESSQFKAERVDSCEQVQIFYHPVVGAEILSEMDYMHEVAELVLQHHERSDGSGYPKGLVGSSIKTLAQILALSETYIELIEGSDNKVCCSTSEALNIMKNKMPDKFDDILVEWFCKVMKGVEIPTSLTELEVYS